jgi:ornithine decarboxylase
MRREHYYNDECWERIRTVADTEETPFVVIDLETVRNNYEQMSELFSFAKIYYAVKANPDYRVLDLLNSLGSSFDIASIYELDKVLKTGVSPDRLSYGNTIKKKKDIQYFYEKGIRLFSTDSEADLRNIAEVAPGSKIYVRILTDGSQTAEWPLSRKFGCDTAMAIDLCVLAEKLGLEPYGVSFHPGSQQKEIDVWDGALAKVKYIFDWLKNEENIQLKMINLGGGFPSSYTSPVHDISVYAEEIKRYLFDDFDEAEMPEIILEPGRSLLGNAGVIVSEVVLISKKSKKALNRWVFTDVGKFNGLIETLDESIKYPVYCDKKGFPGDVVIAGPTCDSMDIMYEHCGFKLPLDLEIGDRLYWFSTGAYTTSYCAVEFNGFPPMRAVFVPVSKK